MKKIISALTSLVIACTSFLGVLPISAEETQAQIQQQPTLSNDIAVEGTNSFGNLLSESIDDKVDEIEENNGCNVFEAVVTGNEAAVSFEINEPCTLLVAIYDEAGEQMLASGSAEITVEETEKIVTIETESMPEYFYLRAFLVDSETLRPICTAYESPNYTQEMQEFFAMTVNDFDEERVLNLDESESNNFAVFSEDTVLIQSDENTNTVVSADENAEIYIIENADESVTSLKNGDIFSLEIEDGNLLIAKVDEIIVDGTTVTITGQDTSMEDVFEYVKIDSSQSKSEITVDDSNLEEGVTYEGIINETDDSQIYSKEIMAQNSALLPSGPSFLGATISGTQSHSLSFKIKNKEFGSKDNNVTLSLDLTFKLGASVKMYLSLSYQFLELKLDYSANVNGSVTGKLTGKVPLAFIGISPVPGVFIELTPSFIVEASGKVTLGGKLTGAIGFKVESDVGKKSLNKNPKFEPTFSIEGTVFLGVSLEPKIKIVSEHAVNISLTAKAGAEIIGKLTGGESTATKMHACKGCIDGDVYAKLSLSATIKLLNSEKLTYKFNILDLSLKIFDFYRSYDKDEFKLESCPYLIYKVNVTVKDSTGATVSGAEVTLNGTMTNNMGTTNEKGMIEGYYPNGLYLFTAQSGSSKGSTKIYIKDEAKNVVIFLGKNKVVSDSSSVKNKVTTTAGEITTPTIQTTVNQTDFDEALSYQIIDDYIEITACDTSATSVEIPAEIDGLPVRSIGDEAFYGCDLTSITIPDSVTSIGDGAFRGSSLTSITIPNSVTSIGNYVFYGCAFTSITIPDSVTGIGDWAFSYCHSLTSITIPDSITSIGNGSFYDCESLTSITIPDSITSIGDSAFSYCESLTSIIIPDSVTSIGNEAFMSSSLTSITIGNSVTSMGDWAFSSCESLTSITIGNSITSIGHDVFSGCSSLTSITIPDSVTSIGDFAFSGSSLTSITIPDSVTSIGDWAFYGCNSLTSITIGESVTSIGHDVFSGCSGLTNITIPDSVTSIGYSAFEDCESLTSITIENPDCEIYDSKPTISNGWNEDGTLYFNGTIYGYENSTAQAYAENWGYNFVAIGGEAKATNKILAQSTSFSSQTTYLSAEVHTAECTDLLPNEVYNFYVFKSIEAESLLSSDNLLFVTQGVSDESGSLTVSYIPTEEYTDAVFIVKAMSQTNLSSADVSLTDMPYNGEEQFAEPVVILDGVTLVKGEHYDIAGDYCATESGTYEITVVGIGDYTGEITASYSITCEHEFINGNCTICGIADPDIGDIVTTVPVTTTVTVTTSVLATTTKAVTTTRVSVTTTKAVTTTAVPVTTTKAVTTTAVPVTTTNAVTTTAVPVTTTKAVTTTRVPVTTTKVVTTVLETTVITVLTTSPTITTPEVEPLIGDISDNGAIDLYDAVEICKYIMEMRDFTDEEMLIADYDYSGTVDLYDVIGIAMELLK